MLIRHFFSIIAFLLFVPSQIFWFWQLRAAARKLIHRESTRRWLGRAVLGIYAVLLIFNLLWPTPSPEPAHLTIRATVLLAPFRWWMLASLLGLALMTCFFIFGLLGRAVQWLYHRMFPPAPVEGSALVSPQRRHFLTRTAVAISATPFVACAYGMLYERTEIETTRLRVMLPRLPQAFDGFRIAQISDIHIGPFMPVEDIRRYVAMVNALKPDMVANRPVDGLDL